MANKELEAYLGLTIAQRNAKAKEIGQRFSEGGAFRSMMLMALGAGLDAKKLGDKSFTFDSTFKAFADVYFSGAKESTITSYKSSFGTFTRAGMLDKWDATATAIKVAGEVSYPLSGRSGMLSKLLKLDHVPTAKDYEKARPKKAKPDDGNIADATASLARKVGDFAVKWTAEMDKNQKVLFAQVVAAVNAYEAAVPLEAKPAKGSAKPKGPNAAELRRQQTAKLMALLPQGTPGARTIQ